jgi:hypothetical protein
MQDMHQGLIGGSRLPTGKESASPAWSLSYLQTADRFLGTRSLPLQLIVQGLHLQLLQPWAR